MQRTRRGPRLGLFLSALLTLPLLWPASLSAAQESWDAIYLGGAKIGSMHIYLQPVKDRGRDLVRVRLDMDFTFKRQDDVVNLKEQYGTIETPDGEVLRLDTRTVASNQEMRTFGDVVDGKMTLTLEGGGQRQEKTIAWGPEIRGPYAPEQSLSRKMMKPGETRSLRMFMPALSKVCDITLSAKGMEEVILGDGKRPLLRVDQATVIDGTKRPEFDVTFWVDPGGQVLKSFTENMGGMTTYRTTREAAMAPSGPVKHNLIRDTIVKVTHKIAKPEASRDIVYRVGLKDGNPTEIFPTDRRQTLRPAADKKGAIMEVRSAGPNDGTPGPETVDDQYLRPNALITSLDPTVTDLAAKAVAGVVDPWDKAVKIERWVAQNLKNKNFETGFAPASEVAQMLSGDCTEHSVLAAAMCRAQGIPARVVVGLVYADHLGGFGFHMWDEVYINRRWVALDSAFDQTSVDAVHIKLAETSLDGVSPYEAFLPIVRVVGKLTLEPIEIR